MSERVPVSSDLERVDDVELDYAHDQLRVGEFLLVNKVGHEHNLREYDFFAQEIQDKIAGSDSVCLEYFPFEIESDSTSFARNNLTFNYYDKEIKPYFSRVAMMAHELNKNIVVLDPAHDEHFAWVRSVIPAVTAGLAAGVAEQAMNMVIPRREFLKAAIGVGVAAGTFLTGSFKRLQEKALFEPTQYPTEDTMRRSVISKGLLQLNDYWGAQNKDQSMAMFYPPVHFAGIEEMLKDNQRRDLEFYIWKSIVTPIGPWAKNSLLSIRVYEPSPDVHHLTWKKVDQIPIV